MRLLAIVEATSITGPAKNLLEFARLARAEGVETVVATFTRGDADTLFLRSARELGLRTETVPESGAWDASVPGKLRDLVDRVAPDIVQTHAVKSHFLIRRSGVPKWRPWIAFHHGYTWPDLKTRAYNQLDRWSLRAARRVVTVSMPFRDELARIGVPRERIEIVHNAIPADWGGPAADLAVPPGAKTILIVGRLSREKDHLPLLEAAARLRPQLQPHLILVGDGPERARIEECTARLSLQANVTFTGHRSSAAPYYGIADVAVLSSLSEGSPNALLEAMATRVPVVATRVGGIPEIVTHEESALLVAPGDVAAMAASLRRLLTDAALAQRLAARGAELIRERHAPEMRMRKLVAIYAGTGSTTADIEPFERGSRQSAP